MSKSLLRIASVLLLVLLVSRVYGDDELISEKFRNLIEQSQRANNEAEAIQFAKAALAIAHTVTEKEQALYVLGRIYIDKGDFIKARSYLDIALNFCIHNNNLQCQGILLLEIGRCQQFNSEYVASLNSLIKGYKLLEQLRFNEGLLRGNVYLAEYYRCLAKYPDALANIHDAMGMAKGLVLKPDLLLPLYNRAAAIYSETGQLDSSLFFSFIALKISRDENNLNQQATSLNEIAFVYENKNRLQLALNYYQQAELIWRKTNAYRYMINALENQARVHGKMHNYRKSNEMLLQIVDTAEAKGWYSSVQGIYSTLEHNFRQMGDREKSYLYLAKSLEAKMKVYLEDNAKELAEIKTRYQSEKNEILLRKQKREIELANADIERNRIETIRLWIGFSLVALLCLVISYLLILRSRSNKQLNQHNIAIEQSNQQLKHSLQQIETLIQEVHHRVKNNLQFIYSILELEIAANKSRMNVESLQGMQRRIMAMSLVHELLYSKDNAEKVSSQQYINDLLEYLDALQNSEKMHVHFETQIEDVLFGINQSIAIGMIISELVANAFKYAFVSQSKPVIKIEVRLLNRAEVELIVEDNGTGFKQHESQGTGMGMRLIGIFASQLNGKFVVDSVNRFKFSLTFPLS
ncbi:MAG: histidine kinase dimerization/phosphoacceptor domain -containing protein [Bacteroidia bacterium]